MNIQHPQNFDQLLDSNYDPQFLDHLQYENFDFLNEYISDDKLISEITTFQDFSDSNFHDSIIDFDVLQNHDIDLDILLNQDLDDDFNQNGKDFEIQDDYFITESEDNAQIIKTSRKSKTKTLLPISMKDVDIKLQIKRIPFLKNEDLINGKPGDRICLSQEEKDLLFRDGHILPTHFPLTKSEERALKSVRRKIRNKISAKNSRAKKETYVEGLEQRITICSKENALLRQKLLETEKDKINLYQQVLSLKTQLAKFIPCNSTRSTSLMLILMTFMIILSPVLDPRQFISRYYLTTHDGNIKQPFPGRTRMLLQESESLSQLGEPYLVTIRPGPPWQVPPKSPAVSLKAIKLIDIKGHSKNLSVLILNKTFSMSTATKDL